MIAEQRIPAYSSSKGYICAGELQIGDMIFDNKGQPTRVVNIEKYKPSQTIHVKMSDGDLLILPADQNMAFTETTMAGIQVATVGELCNAYKGCKFETSGVKLKVPLISKPLNRPKPDVSLPEDPYLYGLIIGGRLSDWEIKDILETNGYHLQFYGGYKPPKAHYTCWLDHLFTVPPKASRAHLQLYLYSDIESRWAFLQGLVDADAKIDKDGRLVFQIKNDLLKLEVCMVLASSLGFNVRNNAYKRRNGLDHTCAFQIYNGQKICRLEQKLDARKLADKSKKSRFKFISNIIPVPEFKNCEHYKITTEAKLKVIGHYCTVIM